MEPAKHLRLPADHGSTAEVVEATDLYDAASAARPLAYAPYSQFAVGAALLTKSGEVITAANVENASYSLTICAERAAVAKAIAEGHRDFVAIAVAGDVERVETLACCGACLQVLAEFDPDDTLRLIFPDHGVLREELLRDLLPVQFKLRS